MITPRTVFVRPASSSKSDQGWDGLRLIEHSTLYSDDLKAVNTAADPERVGPEAGDGKTLRRHSWNLLRYAFD